MTYSCSFAYNKNTFKIRGKQSSGFGMVFSTRLVWYPSLGAGNNVTARPGSKKASAGGAKMAVGCIDGTYYFLWFTIILIVPPADFLW